MEERIGKLSEKIDEVKTDINWWIISEFLEWFSKKDHIKLKKALINFFDIKNL